MGLFFREARLAIRSLRRDPVFSLTAILTLALGIGATTAVFSVLHGVLLAPLPFPDGERLVRLYSTNPRQDIERGPMSGSDLWDMRAASTIAAASPVYPYEGTLEDEQGNPIRIPAYVVSADFFEVFRSPMALGRGFFLEEDEPNSPFEVVLSHQLWQSALGGDPEIVGKSITIDAGTAVVVGVAGPELRYPRDAALWALPGFDWENLARRGRTWDAVARVAPTATLGSAELELERVAATLAEEYPQWNASVGIRMVGLKESIVGDLSIALLILMAASAGLLAVAAVNVGNLLIARGAARMQETALRGALGASRWRLMATLLSEAGVTAMAGALAGVLLAVVGLTTFQRLAPPELALLGDVGFGWQALAFAAAITLGATLLFGLLPAIRASATDLRSLLGDGGRRSTADGGGVALRSGLVVTEVAVATALVIGSGLLLRSFQNVMETDPGFETREALTFNLAPPMGVYTSPDDISAFYRQVLAELRSGPGVDAATAMATMPLSTEYDPYRPIQIAELPTPEAGDEPQAYQRSVYPGFFHTLGIPLVEGRAFDEFDNPEGPAVAIVNEAFVRRYLPEGRALDREIEMLSTNFWPLGRMLLNPVRVVGVVGDVRYAGLTEEPQPTIYFPFLQAPFRRLTILMTSQGDPAALMTAARQRVAQVDGQIAISGIRTFEDVIRASTVSQRFTATLLLVFGVVALVLAAVGIYGVVTYQVTERTREMAVRMSVGATPREVVALILRSGARIWGLGLVAGFVGAFALRRIVATQLYGVSATDPAVFVGAAVVLGVVALAATAAPAIRATRVEPAVVLREG
ncbi:MAG: ABC transporter permease [Longimicrobiales bacterium]|nr:ABC transporter permease [Longimicrobiales bacterium]